jgi:hypothetical protein
MKGQEGRGCGPLAGLAPACPTGEARKDEPLPPESIDGCCAHALPTVLGPVGKY